MGKKEWLSVAQLKQKQDQQSGIMATIVADLHVPEAGRVFPFDDKYLKDMYRTASQLHMTIEMALENMKRRGIDSVAIDVL